MVWHLQHSRNVFGATTSMIPMPRSGAVDASPSLGGGDDDGRGGDDGRVVVW
jgi:hypothetical protein